MFVIRCKQTLVFMKLLVIHNFIHKYITAWQGLKNYCFLIDFVYLALCETASELYGHLLQAVKKSLASFS